VDGLLAAGLIFARTGDRAAARRYLQHGLEVSPNYEEMRAALTGLGNGAGHRKRKRT
jgi:Tfp pilus assembly protein PilF